MKRIQDPFPPTPEGFHRRIEATLQSLEERDMKHGRIYGKTALLVAAIVAALLAATALAAVLGHSNFKRKLNDENLPEVAGLVQEPHATADGDDGFAFSIDEMIWEAGDLYISYSLSVPEDGGYIVAMTNPTLNGQKLQYDPKGWTSPKFIDPASEDDASAVLLLGGNHDTSCNELWTFAVDPRLRQNPDNCLSFRAVLMKTDLDLAGGSDWTDMLDPPDCLQFNADWRELRGEAGAAQASFMDAVISSIAADGSLTPDALAATGHAAYVSERAVSLGLDAAGLEQAVYNDLKARDFEVDGCRVHVDAFTMTHLGVEIEYTLAIPGATRDDRDAMKRYEAILDKQWRFSAVDGTPLGYSLGGSGGAGLETLDDGTAVYHCSWRESLILPLSDIDEIIFAPVAYSDDAEGNQLPPEYDMDRALALTPVYDPDIVATETQAPIIEPGENISK